MHLTGETGRFAGATGDINAIGEADLVKGTIGSAALVRISGANRVFALPLSTAQAKSCLAFVIGAKN